MMIYNVVLVFGVHKVIQLCLYVCVCVYVCVYYIYKHVQSCSTLCDHVNCSPPGSSVHGIFQARILEWVAISFSRGSSRPSD